MLTTLKLMLPAVIATSLILMAAEAPQGQNRKKGGKPDNPTDSPVVVADTSGQFPAKDKPSSKVSGKELRKDSNGRYIVEKKGYVAVCLEVDGSSSTPTIMLATPWSFTLSDGIVMIATHNFKTKTDTIRFSTPESLQSGTGSDLDDPSAGVGDAVLGNGSGTSQLVKVPSAGTGVKYRINYCAAGMDCVENTQTHCKLPSLTPPAK
jgi:hypothetical protein